MTNVIHHWVIEVIIILLSLNALREAVALIGVVKRDWRYSWLVYGRYDEQIVDHALKRLGFDRREVEIAVSLVSHLRPAALSSPLLGLLAFIHRHLFKFNRELTYGKQTPISSRFYINTMEAVHDRSELVLMCDLLNMLLKRRSTERYPDFVLTPKTGNPILGTHFAEMNNLCSVLRKDGSDTSRARFDRGEARNSFLINFEGAENLLKQEAQARADERRLVGAVIDCNASGGSAVLDSMKEFNDLVKAMNVSIQPIAEAYILFRPDNKDDIDGRFREQGFKVHRFVDLNEEMKEMLYESNVRDAFRAGDRQPAVQVLRRLIEKNMVKTEISTDELG